ncbi:hypothetical protein HK102_002370 [Quaeritorhiza haematococci]|nr:hypothetical protein HK102_002370 [Quaeritorhiza haematococci]
MGKSKKTDPAAAEAADPNAPLKPGQHPANGSSASSMFPRPGSTPDRLVIDLFTANWVSGKPKILEDDIINTIPPQIAAKGVDPVTWTKWMNRFRKDTARHTMSILETIFWWTTLVCVPVWIWKNNKRQRLVAKFLADFNREVMEPHGMYFKTQTGIWHNWDGKGQGHDLTVSWASVALTPQGVAQLKEEEYFLDYNPWTKRYSQWTGSGACCAKWCCGGVMQVV